MLIFVVVLRLLKRITKFFVRFLNVFILPLMWSLLPFRSLALNLPPPLDVGDVRAQASTVHDQKPFSHKLKDVVATHFLPQTSQTFECFSANDFSFTPSVEVSRALSEPVSPIPTSVGSIPISSMTDAEYARHCINVNASSSALDDLEFFPLFYVKDHTCSLEFSMVSNI